MKELIKREDVNEVIDVLEVYTVGRMNTEKVQISVLQLQRLINDLKNIPTAYDVEAKVAELEKQVEQYDRRAEEHKDYEDYYSRYYGKARSYEHAISIIRRKE